MKLILSLLLSLIGTLSFSQSFISPLENGDIGQMKSAIVYLEDGTEIKGIKFSSFMLTNGQLNSFTLKKENGEKQKFKAAEIKMVKIEPNGFAKTMMKASSPNLVAAIKKDYSAIDKMKYVIFEKVEIKKGKFKLLQLLNPGLDDHIKVYLDPNAKEGMSLGGIVGGADKSYFIKKGDRTFLLKKKNYKKEFTELFGECQPLVDMVSSDEVGKKFKELAVHIAIYNENI